jgi:hypothetical protein
VRDDVPIDSKMFLMTDFVNLKIKPAQYFECAHRVMMCMFIWVNAHTYINIYIYTVFINNISENCAMSVATFLYRARLSPNVKLIRRRRFIEQHQKEGERSGAVDELSASRSRTSNYGDAVPRARRVDKSAQLLCPRVPLRPPRPCQRRSSSFFLQNPGHTTRRSRANTSTSFSQIFRRDLAWWYE